MNKPKDLDLAQMCKTILLAPYVKPVTVSECWMCGGTGYREKYAIGGWDRCGICAGTGRISSDGGEP
jgi:hypothetical protein